MTKGSGYVRWLDELSSRDVPLVGGKNASLGEMIGSLKEKGVRAPGGFATTADAYRQFVEANGLSEKIRSAVESFQRGEKALNKVGRAIRRMFVNADFPGEMASPFGQDLSAFVRSL